MASLNFEKGTTALLVIDPYNDFISDGGIRRAHGSTLDGSQVLGNDNAVSFAGQGCA
jgi:nicotinamidase-related amidase